MKDLEACLEELGLKEPPCLISQSTQNLRFYELGAFIQAGEKKWIEIRPVCRWLKLLGYSEKTILKHELIHAMRCHYPDSFWEELLAYHISKRSYQKWLGPFITKKSVKLTLLGAYIFAFLGISILSIIPFFLTLSFLVLKHHSEYNCLKRVIKRLSKNGMRKEAALQKCLTLSPEELEILAKKTSAGVRNF